MKKIIITVVVLVAAFSVKAQEFSVGADVVSSYVWRGQYLGGAAVQPAVGFSAGGFSIGAWGSVDLVNQANVKEFDLAIGYEIAGVSIGITDYWIQEQAPFGENAGYFNYDVDKGSLHVFELNLGYTLPIESLPLSLSWNTNLFGADATNEDGDNVYSTYIEAAYPFKVGDVSLDAAIGVVPWETSFYAANGLAVTNLSLKASKEIKIANFTLPAFGQIVINPRAEDAFLVFGVSF